MNIYRSISTLSISPFLAFIWNIINLPGVFDFLKNWPFLCKAGVYSPSENF